MLVGIRYEHLGQRRFRGRRRQRIPEQRAAGCDVACPVQFPSQLGADTVRAHRQPSCDRLANRDHVRLQLPDRRRATGSHHVGVGLVDAQQRAVLPGQGAERLVPAGFGRKQMDRVRHRRLGQHQGHVGGLQRPAQRAGVVELGDPHPAGHPFGQAPLQSTDLAALDIHQALLEVAVVMPLEQDDHLAAGDGPRQPDDLGVSLRGRQRELPLGNRIAAGKFLGHLRRGLSRQQELRGPGRLLLDRAYDRRIRVPAEHRHVRGIEVDVAETVQIGETRAVTMVDVHRLVVVRGHPGHRHAVRHMRASAIDHGKRQGPVLPEARKFPAMQLTDPGPIKIP